MRAHAATTGVADTLSRRVPGIEQDVRAYAPKQGERLCCQVADQPKFSDAGYPGINHANFALELQRKALQKQKSPFNSRYQLEDGCLARS